MSRPIGSNHTSAPWTSLFMWTSTTPARATQGKAKPASASPPACRNARRVAIARAILLERDFLVFRDVPEHHVVVRLSHAGMPRVVVHVDVIDFLLRDTQIVKLLVRVDVLDGDHVDRTHEFTVAVVGEERTGRERGGHDIQRAQVRKEIGEFHEGADLLVLTARRRHRLPGDRLPVPDHSKEPDRDDDQSENEKTLHCNLLLWDRRSDVRGPNFSRRAPSSFSEQRDSTEHARVSVRPRLSVSAIASIPRSCATAVPSGAVVAR